MYKMKRLFCVLSNASLPQTVELSEIWYFFDQISFHFIPKFELIALCLSFVCFHFSLLRVSLSTWCLPTSAHFQSDDVALKDCVNQRVPRSHTSHPEPVRLPITGKVTSFAGSCWLSEFQVTTPTFLNCCLGSESLCLGSEPQAVLCIRDPWASTPTQ